MWHKIFSIDWVKSMDSNVSIHYIFSINSIILNEYIRLYLISPILLIDEDIRWDYQVDISFESKSRGMSWDYQVGLTFRSKAEVSSGTIRWDYHLRAIVEV